MSSLPRGTDGDRTPWTLVPGDEHDQELVRHVHPPDWTNPTPKDRYDLVVIGAGTAGLVAAAGAAGLGARVALVEGSLMGGDCLNVGCVPSKALLRAARAVADTRKAAELGIEVAEPTVDFAAVMDRVRAERAAIAPHDSASRFTELGVDVFLGQGRFTSGDAVEVEGARLSFRRALIATGARAAELPIPGLVEVGALTNETLFNLTELPKRLTIIGGGPIGCEMAQAFARLGSAVTIVSNDRLLANDDADAAAIVERSLRDDGVSLELDAKVDRVERVGGGTHVVFTRGSNEHSVAADRVLVAVGRAPNVEDLGLEAAGVELERGHVAVDDRLRTTSSRIYASGDVCSRFKFTHAAEDMSRLVIQNALFFMRKKVSALTIPWCTYTDPEVAHVGLSREDAEAAGHEVATFTHELASVDRSKLDGETDGFVRLHCDAKSGRLLGGTIVAPHAGESIGQLTLALGQGLTAADLDATIHPYPTVAEAIRRAATQWQHARFSPRVAKAMKSFFRIVR